MNGGRTSHRAMRRAIGAWIAGAALLAPPTAFAQEVAPSLPPEGEVVFHAVLDLHQTAGAQPQLRHGEVVSTADWPAVLYATFLTSRGEDSCTSALVGKRALLTAAHCVPASNLVAFKFGGVEFKSDCERHPLYLSRTDLSADFALCKVRARAGYADGVTMPVGGKFESVSLDAMDGHISRPSDPDPLFVTLTGYGCISDIVRVRSTDRNFRIGLTKFVESSNAADGTRDPGRYAPAERNNLMTIDDLEYANLCPGDSGGPAYIRIDGKRVIIGVNSRVFYKDSAQTAYGASLVSATGGPDFAGWALGWAKDRAKVAVCGVHGDGSGCAN